MSGHDGHTHSRTEDRRRLSIALGLAVGTAILEIAGGIASGSLALFADAGHVVTDATALTLALAAVAISRRPHTLRLTYGYHRAEVLAASANGILLLGIAALIGWHAIGRLRDPHEIEAGTLLIVALVGLASNAAALAILHGSHSLNVRGARLHVLSDLGGSVAAVTAGVIAQTTGWDRADTILSLLIVGMVCFGAWRLLRDTVGILMQRTPEGVDLPAIEAALREVPGVRAVHDVHVWMVTSDFLVFTAHVEVAGTDVLGTVQAATDLLRERFGIDHGAIHPEATRLIEIGEPRKEHRN